MSVCTACGEPLVPAVDVCLGCGERAGPEPKVGPRRLLVSNVIEVEVCVRMLTSLTGADEPNIRAMVENGGFAVIGEATEDEFELLATAIRASSSADARVFDGFAVAENPRFRLSPARMLVPKLGVTASLGLAAYALGSPFVPAAALLTLAILLVRAIQTVPTEVEIGKTSVAERLGLFDRTLLGEIRATNGGLGPEARSSLRATLSQIAELTGALRADGLHLHDPGVARIDRQLQQLARRTTALARASARLDTAPPDLGAANGLRREMGDQIAAIEPGLRALRPAIATLRSTGARRDALSPTIHALDELQTSIELALTAAEGAGARG